MEKNHFKLLAIPKGQEFDFLNLNRSKVKIYLLPSFPSSVPQPSGVKYVTWTTLTVNIL